MDLTRKLAIRADAAKYDASCASSGSPKRDSVGGKGMGSTEGMGICHSYAPDGRCISLLKILLTNFCIYDCLYCVNRVSSNTPRARFTVEEVVQLTLDFYSRNYIEGLFLSSGIIRDADYTMEQMVRVAQTLSELHDFRGYIHLKTIPDASYASIFNPARLNVNAMRAHMPQKYWRNLPESELIPQLIADAQERTWDMIARAPTQTRRTARKRLLQPVPINYDDKSLAAVRSEAEHCRACPLWKNATQTVFGAGRKSAKIVFVGEQPGDQEDLAGEPFVGPAGKLLDRALRDAGIERSATYVTNAVKHFKFEPRGKRRIHKKPNEQEISACHQWLERELNLVEPQLVVALGATAARAVCGRVTVIEKNRGHIMHQGAAHEHNADVLVTVHPSYLLRIPDEDKHAAYERFVEDLKLAKRYA